jgi:hypothetical protein
MWVSGTGGLRPCSPDGVQAVHAMQAMFLFLFLYPATPRRRCSRRKKCEKSPASHASPAGRANLDGG